MHDAETVAWVAVTTTLNDVSDETTTDADPVPVEALVAGRSSTEAADPGRPQVITGMTIYLIGTDVVPGPSDWFTIRGHRYDVVGEAHRWGDSGVEVAVQRAGARATA